LLQALGGEAGCKRLSTEFYKRVARDPVLRPLFPGKSQKCAIEEFSAFLVQFLGGDEEQTQRRWWLSLRESHARFEIGPAERHAWLKNMTATLDAASLDAGTRESLRQFFEHTSTYVMGPEAHSIAPQPGNDGPPGLSKRSASPAVSLPLWSTPRSRRAAGQEARLTGAAGPEHEDLAERWSEQRVLDDTIAAMAAGRDEEALALAPRFVSRPSVFIGLLARMVQSGRAALVRYAVDVVERDPSLAAHSFGGRTLLHYASGAGCLEVVECLLRLGMEPDAQDGGGHTALYRVANQCASEMGPKVARALLQAGADVNACGGVTRSTPLHMAARRGHAEIARVLLDCGANINARDSKRDTPLQRALNCRRNTVAQLLAAYGSTPSTR
jgi:hemoglobin